MEHPQRPAILFEDRVFVRDELRRAIKARSDFLRTRVPARSLLGILLPNGPELLVTCIACWKAGLVPVPLHVQMKEPEIRALLCQARIRHLVTTVDGPGDFAGTALAWIARVPADGGATGAAAPVVETRMPHQAAAEPAAPAWPADLALVLHTSGTTLHPRGVMLSRANLDGIIADRLARTGLAADSVLITASCLTQSVGLYQALAALAAGATLVLLRSYELEPMVRAVREYRPTHLIMVVEAFDRLLHHPDLGAADLAALRFAAVGADRVPARVQDRFMALAGRPLCVTYGLTESSWALVNDGSRADRRLSLGTPGADVEIRLRSATGGEVPAGTVGEIHIRSPRTMLGYVDDAEGTRAVLRDGWLASGDLAWRDEDGWYWFAGRSREVIVVAGGDVVSPAEVEAALLDHPRVGACAVIGVGTDGGSEEPWAFVAPRDGAITAAELQAWLRIRISDYKVPRRVVLLDVLPVGAGGKVSRAALRELAAGMALRRP